MPRGKQDGAIWWWVSCAAFLLGFVFLHEITRGEETRLVAETLLVLAALGYTGGLFLLRREGGGRAGPSATSWPWAGPSPFS